MSVLVERRHRELAFEVTGSGPVSNYGDQFLNSGLDPADAYPIVARVARALAEVEDQTEREIRSREAQPLPIRLHCPECNVLHVDKGRFATHGHHTHSCQSCGATWRPAVEHTVGVQFLPGFRDEEAVAARGRAPEADGIRITSLPPTPILIDAATLVPNQQEVDDAFSHLAAWPASYNMGAHDRHVVRVMLAAFADRSVVK